MGPVGDWRAFAPTPRPACMRRRVSHRSHKRPQEKVPAFMQPDTSSTVPSQGTRPTGARLDGRTLVLIAGDALAFLVFAAIGRKSHGEAAGPGVLGEIVWTALPFALGWFVVAPFLGAFRREGAERPLGMLRRTGLAWVASWPATLLLRWLFVERPEGYPLQASFAIVILVANAILLGGWRTAFAALSSRRMR